MRLIACVLGLALALAGTAQSGINRASLVLVTASPLSVRGIGFAPAEKVKLLVTGDSVASRVTVAGPRGGFLVRFSLRTSRCSAIMIRAVGNRGHRAMIDRTATACDPDPGSS